MRASFRSRLQKLFDISLFLSLYEAYRQRHLAAFLDIPLLDDFVSQPLLYPDIVEFAHRGLQLLKHLDKSLSLLLGIGKQAVKELRRVPQLLDRNAQLVTVAGVEFF